MNLGYPGGIWGVFGVFCEGLLTPPNYLRRDPSNVTGDTEARHTAHTAAGLRHEEAVLPTRILVGKVAVTTFVTHKHPFWRISRILYPQVGFTCPCTFRLRGVYRHVWHEIRVLKHENYDPWATF